MGFSRDEIKKWKIEGWTFRKKTVKNHIYITRRKGNQEKSLGKYDEKLWDLIEDTKLELSEFEQRRDAINNIMEIVELIREREKSIYCSHIVADFCHFWKYSEKPGFFRTADSDLGTGFYKQIENNKNPSFWVFKAEPFYCKNCTAYIRD